MPYYSGQDIGRYHILEPLGEGSMATVYKAFDTHLECNVAVKFIRMDRVVPEMVEKALLRFEREAKLLAQLNHPNIVKVTDYGTYQGVPYLVMPYLPGGTLEDLIGKVVPYAEAAHLLAPIARALSYAHMRNILHRDVKPSNLLIAETGQLILSDFGVAKIFEEDPSISMTGTGMMIGTPEYMAPEQWHGRTEPVSDEYGLGVVLYELVTGQIPYQADTPAGILLKQMNEPLPSPRQFVPGLPDRIEQVILTALAKDPRYRYPNLSAFAFALEEIAAEAPSAGFTLPFLVPPTENRPPANNITMDEAPQGYSHPQNALKRYGWLLAVGVTGLLLVLCVVIALVLKGVMASQTAVRLTPTSLGNGVLPTLAPTLAGEIVPSPVLTSTQPPTAVPAQAGNGWKQGQLVYLSGSKTARDVYWLDLQTGGEPKLIAASNGNDRFYGVVLSPDGSRLVWYDTNTATLKQAGSSGGDVSTLAKCEQPFFSPDGSRLVCVGKDGLQIISAQDGTTQNVLSTGTLRAVLPAWSPTKDEIVFAAYRADGGTGIWRVGLSGGDPTPLADTTYENYAPAFSPDGEWIAFQSSPKDADSQIWIMDRSGGQARQLTQIAGWSRGPGFSPDGRWLVFVSSQSGSIGPDSGEAFALSLDTSEQVRLTHTGGGVYDWRAFWGK